MERQRARLGHEAAAIRSWPRAAPSQSSSRLADERSGSPDCHPMSNPSGILPNVFRMTVATTSPLSGSLLREKASAPAMSSSRIINSACWMALPALRHSTAAPGANPSPDTLK
jgi:hypothetical protein